MAELRTEISDLATKIDAAGFALNREVIALKALHEALTTRAKDEATQAEAAKLAELEPKITALDIEPSKPRAAATTHAKTH